MDEEALAFRASFEATVIGHVHVDLRSGAVIRANSAFFEMVGLPRESVIGRPLTSFLHVDDQGALAEAIAAIVADPLMRDARDQRLARPNGEQLWARISLGATNLDVAGVRGTIVALVENVEARRSALEHLESANARLEQMVKDRTAALAQLSAQEKILRSIFDTGPDAVLMVDPRGLITNFSAAAERIFGCSSQEMLGRHIALLIPESYPGFDEDTPTEKRPSGDHILGMSREVNGRRRDGSTFPMMLFVGQLDIEGERHHTKFVRDLTAQKEAAHQTEALRGQLSQLWGLNSLGEMAAVLAHELNQPLAAIANYIHGVRAIVTRLELPDDSALDGIDRAIGQTIRAGEIIRRMRTMIASGDSAKHGESLIDIIADADFMINLISRDKGVIVLYDLANDKRNVYVDRIQIQQVLLNLLRNAVESMDSGPTRVVEIAARPDTDGWIVSVHDSGPGISPEIASRLFSPLASTKSEGMGLGLALSKTIVENHGGQVWLVQSKHGGACFCFSLPYAPEQTPSTEPAAGRKLLRAQG